MPLKFVAGAVIVVGVAIAIAVYENREQFYEFTEGPRQQFAEFLHKVADGMTPNKKRQRQAEEVPLSGRPLTPSSSESSQTEKNNKADTTGQDLNQKTDSLRFRGGTLPHSISPTSSSQPMDEKEGGELRSESAITDKPTENINSLSSPTIPSPPLDAQSSPRQRYPPPPASNASYTSAATLQHEIPFNHHQPFWSIHEWASNAHHSDATVSHPPSSPSLAGSAESEDIDRLSDIGSVSGSDPGSAHSWTDVASEISG